MGGDVHGTTDACLPSVLRPSPNGVGPGLFPTAAEGRVKRMRRCEQQPSPNARETRPQRGRDSRFLRSVFEGWARAASRPLSRGLNLGVARLPRWPTGWAGSLSGSLAAQGAGLRVGRDRWSGHYPRGRPRWFGPEPVQTTALRTLTIRTIAVEPIDSDTKPHGPRTTTHTRRCPAPSGPPARIALRGADGVWRISRRLRFPGACSGSSTPRESRSHRLRDRRSRPAGTTRGDGGDHAGNAQEAAAPREHLGRVCLPRPPGSRVWTRGHRCVHASRAGMDRRRVGRSRCFRGWNCSEGALRVS